MRTIRDLREIINVSRLNYNNDDDEIQKFKIDNHIEIDSNDFYESSTLTKSKSQSIPKPISSTKIPSKSNETRKSTIQTEHVLLSRNSLPRSSTNKSIILEDEFNNKTSLSIKNSIVISKFDDLNLNDNANNDDLLIVEGNFDHILTYIDTSIVGEWLNRANKHLKDLFNWLEVSKCESFIHFSNFWLTKLNDKQRRDLINMEYSIIVEEVSQAFLIGIECEKLNNKDIKNLLKAVFKEYPLTLLSFRGLYLLLDYIDILCSDRKEEYKKLLSDVKCRTLNKQYAQWLLSIRSFALVNLCAAIVKFYQNANAEPTVLAILRAKSAPANTARKSTGDQAASALRQSIVDMSLIPTSIEAKYKYYKDTVFKNDYVEVLHYLITTKKCDPLQKDEHNRTLIFLAVMNDQPKILNYLIKRWPKIDINEPCDTGNTPLHAAVNNGKLNIVDILLKSKNLDVNIVNKTCMNATALHLAVWHNHDEIALLLIRNKSDPYLKMGDVDKNAFELAKDTGNDVLAELLVEFYNESKNVYESINNNKSTFVDKK